MAERSGAPDIDRRLEYACAARHFWEAPAVVLADESYGRADGLPAELVRCPECAEHPVFSWEAFSFIAERAEEA